jgi:hypothetical protein
MKTHRMDKEKVGSVMMMMKTELAWNESWDSERSAEGYREREREREADRDKRRHTDTERQREREREQLKTQIRG